MVLHIPAEEREKNYHNSCTSQVKVFGLSEICLQIGSLVTSEEDNIYSGTLMHTEQKLGQ